MPFTLKCSFTVIGTPKKTGSVDGSLVSARIASYCLAIFNEFSKSKSQIMLSSTPFVAARYANVVSASSQENYFAFIALANSTPESLIIADCVSALTFEPCSIAKFIYT